MKERINTFVVLVAYFALATPVQPILWFFTGPKVEYARWVFALNCGSYFQAIAILAAMAVLRSRLTHRSHKPVSEKQIGSLRLFVTVGISSGLLAALAWYYSFRLVSGYSGQRDYIFGLRYFPGYTQLRAGVSYYHFFSVFIAIYLGILAGDLAWRSLPPRRLINWTAPQPTASASAFAWQLWVCWLAFYQLSEWIYVMWELAASQRMSSLAYAYLSFLPLIATSIACVPVSYWLFATYTKIKELLD